MQSSTAIAFRALVMLICMISIPLFAIFGKDLPEVIKNLLAGRLVVRVTDSTSANQPAIAPAAAGNLPTRPNSPFSEPASYRAEGAATGPAGAQPTSVHASAANSATAQPAGFQAPSESRPIPPNEYASREVSPVGNTSDQTAGESPRLSSGANGGARRPAARDPTASNSAGPRPDCVNWAPRTIRWKPGDRTTTATALSARWQSAAIPA